ncbi:hypothetical protein Nepgr_028473 [Nepenthes gracilis]|uniref:NAC domain-containing protein n=1 Tax=Nepenthes gracilis TaxID=150966 RepID=A0AAD3TAF3_NEPGR|nr:hypothetical protein Nepgr_028473 [Nepenthes gracilis]
MNTLSHVPPGFRFYPTDEELVDYYLRKKVASRKIDLDVITDVDLYKIEPWDLQELCKIGNEEQSDWYFFSHKDRKYPTGSRTNRATKAGFWKATGRDKAIYSKHSLIGMRKTLVFYKGRAPNGHKSDWIMHEYRLETHENRTPQEEGWVVCRVFKKRTATVRKMSDHSPPCWYEDQASFMADMIESPRQISHPYTHYQHSHQPCKQELGFPYNLSHDPFFQLPQLESPKVPNSSSSIGGSSAIFFANNPGDHAVDQVTDWRVLDKFVASQLSQEEAPPKESNFSGEVFEPVTAVINSKKPEVGSVLPSTSSASSRMIDLWK